MRAGSRVCRVPAIALALVAALVLGAAGCAGETSAGSVDTGGDSADVASDDAGETDAAAASDGETDATPDATSESAATTYDETDAIEAVWLADEGLFVSETLGSFTAEWPADASELVELLDDGTYQVIAAEDVPDGAVVLIWDEDGIVQPTEPAQLGATSHMVVIGVDEEAAATCREELGL